MNIQTQSIVMKNSMNMRSFPARALLGSLAVMALAACGDGEAAPQGGGGPMRMAAAVETGLVEVGSISRAVTVSGVVEPLRVVGVNSQLSGALLSVEVEEGMRVQQGQVLARLDDRELAAQEASLEAAFAVAEAAYQRAEQLRASQVITISEYERDRTAYASALAQLDQVRTRRGYAVVRSPLDGLVLEKLVESGDVVAPQTQLFRIGDNETMVVRVPVSELDVVELSTGDEASIIFDAFPNRVFSGTIRRIFPSADPGSRLVPVEVALDREAATTARPGFLARVTFALGARSGVRLVPASAIVSGTGGQGIFTVEQGHVTRRSVQTGLTSEGQVEVLRGVEEGDTIVITGGSTLRDGSPVRIVAGPGSSGAAAADAEAEENPTSGGTS